MLQFHMEDYSSEISFPLELVFIQDGNALFHSLIYFLSISWYPKKKLFFSTHSHHPDSIKTQEGCQSGCDSCSFWKDQEQEKLSIFCSWYTLNRTCCTHFYRNSSSNPVFKHTGQLYYLMYLLLSNPFFFLTGSLFNLLDDGSWNRTILSMLKVLGSSLLNANLLFILLIHPTV